MIMKIFSSLGRLDKSVPFGTGGTGDRSLRDATRFMLRSKTPSHPTGSSTFSYGMLRKHVAQR